MAAIACAYLNGADAESAVKALADFSGAEGRFTEVGFYNGARIIADYAHHPDSVKVTLKLPIIFHIKSFMPFFNPLPIVAPKAC